MRLFPTIARFDIAYVTVFLCNLKMIRYSYPNLYRWFRRLYWDQGERTRGAFYKTTQPYLGLYAEGYSRSKSKVLYGADVAPVVPRGPAVLIDPLEDNEKE